MTDVRVISTERLGSLVAVVVEVEADEVFSVDGPRRRRMVRETLYLPYPLSAELLDERVAAIRNDISTPQPPVPVSEPPALQERCFVNGDAQRDFYRADACPQDVIDALLASFPGLDLSRYSLISSPSYNEVIGQDVVSTFMWEDDVPALVVNGIPAICRSRKFCLGAGKWFDRLYLLAEASESSPLLPPSCVLLGKSRNVNAQPGLELPDFYDLYFRGDDAEIQQAFSLPPITGSHKTYYGVTVVDGKVVRAKQYCYDTSSAFSDWDGTARRVRQAHGNVVAQNS